MTKMWSLLSLVVLAALTTASTEKERVFSRQLAQKEGYELTQEEQLVDAFMTVLDHITKNKDPQHFNGDHLLNMLKKNRDVPFLASLEKKFQPVHDASKSSIHTLISIMSLWEEIIEEVGMSTEAGRDIMAGHELYDQVSDRLDTGRDHGGQSAFGTQGHLKKSSQI